MNLAITLLVAIAIAAVIGTVLKQNEAYQNYIIKFGPFWFEVFEKLALFDVYSATWFLLILTLLVISTSACIYRNAPRMLKDMRHFRLDVQEKSLRALHNHQQWRVSAKREDTQAVLAAVAQAHGYKLRAKDHGNHLVLSGMKGAWNRLGYIFTHAAIVIICIGGLLDGNVPLKLKERSGQIQIETRDIPAAEVPDISWLPVENPSFRGSVTIPEGGNANLAFLRLRDGYLVQPLPFRIEVKDFRIEHYFSGQPKSFESDLLIHDPELAEPLQQTIAVNHPLIYKGYAIYQASFNDGGTGLKLRAWPLTEDRVKSYDFESAVFEEIQVSAPEGPLTMEMIDFRLFNINPTEAEDADKKFRNYGPNYTFKLRDASGVAKEYENYMAPVEFDGRLMFLSGMRATPAEPFRYLHIPADADGSLQRFLKFNARLRDPERVRRLAEQTTRSSFADIQMENPDMAQEVIDSMVRLVARFAERGAAGLMEQAAQTAPGERQSQVMDAYLKVLQTILGALYSELLRDEGIDVSTGISDAQAVFFDDSLNAISALPNYGSPFFAQLASFEHVQATGLQIARAPGKNVVYLGCALLTIGVFLMFYVPHSRLWFRLARAGDGDATELLFAGSGNRHQRDFAEEFAKLTTALEQTLTLERQP